MYEKPTITMSDQDFSSPKIVCATVAVAAVAVYVVAGVNVAVGYAYATVAAVGVATVYAGGGSHC